MEQKAKELIEESISAPVGRLSEIAVELTSIKAYFSEQLDAILIFKADRIQQLRVELETVASAKLAWNASDEGKQEIKLRGIIGRIKDQIGVIKYRLNVKRDESFGTY